MTDFLPTSYEVPKAGGNYLKLQQGDNVIRILSTPIIGWEDWDDNKPVRFPYTAQKPAPIDPTRPVKHFWAFVVWDYQDKRLKILEITQSTIQEVIKNLNDDTDWGSPLNYDINIKKTGEKMETKYSVIAKPPKQLDTEIIEAYAKTHIDLNQLFSGGDPFAEKHDDEVNINDIPFD